MGGEVLTLKMGSTISEIGLKVGLEESNWYFKFITSEILLDPFILWSSILRLVVETDPISVGCDTIIDLTWKS